MDAVMPVLILDEIEAALDFYLNTLEFEQRWSRRDEASGKLTNAALKFGDANLMLFAQPDGAGSGPNGAVELWFWSSDRGYDLDGYYERLRSRDGVTIVEEIDDRHWGDRTFKVVDPFGFTWHFGRTLGQYS